MFFRSHPPSHGWLWPILKGECSVLVLSRKKNESIVINNEITIVVVEIAGGRVRLGVEAPKKVPVHRREVVRKQKRRGVAGEQPTCAEETPEDKAWREYLTR